jgi:glycosyltransferase involved in cell wall biosynthesis
MKILHMVEFYHPSVGGMQEVVRQLSERLVQLGHEVTVATTRLPDRERALFNGVRIEEFDIRGNLANGITGETERYRTFVMNGGFDVLTNFAAQQWATDAVITVLEQIPGRKVFVPTGFSGLYSPLYRDYFENMGTWMQQYDMNVFLSDNYRDINFARENGVNNTIIIPNGAAEDEFLPEPDMDIRKKLRIPHDHLLVLHVGSHTGIKGHSDAMQIFARACIKNATLLIVANDVDGGCARKCLSYSTMFNLSPFRIFDRKRIKVTSLLRNDTVAAYHAADMFLFPSNVECSPLVLFECMASRTPFLTSDVGNAAEIVCWSGGGSLLPTRTGKDCYAHADLNASTRMLEEMATNSKARKEFAESGFSAWRERFTWERIARDYEFLYYSITKDYSCS